MVNIRTIVSRRVGTQDNLPPEKLHQPLPKLNMSALISAYPCKK